MSDGLSPQQRQLLLAWLDAALPAEPLPDWGVRMLEGLAELPTAVDGPGCES